MSVFWSSHKLFSAFLLRSVALVVHLHVFLINVSHQSFQFYVVESTIAFLWYSCAFREGTFDYFLYKLIKFAKFAIFLIELCFFFLFFFFYLQHYYNYKI